MMENGNYNRSMEKQKPKNRLMKVMLWISAFCVVIGIILLAAGAAGGGLNHIFKPENWRPVLTWRGISFGTHATMDKEDIFEEFSGEYLEKMILDATYGDVSIERGESLGVYAENVSERKYECSLENGVLKIKDTDKAVSLFGNRFGKHDGRNIRIIVPEGVEIGELELSMGAGELMAEGIYCEKATLDVGAGEGIVNGITVKDKLEVTVGAGEFNVQNISIGDSERKGECLFNCGAGELNANGCIYADMEVECGVGEINLQLQEDARNYEYDVSCGIGEVMIDGNSYKEFRGGHHSEHGYGKDYEVEVDCGVGQVEIQFVG